MGINGPYLEKNVYFMRARPWERHDDHYHVDFDVPFKMWEGRSGRVRS